MGVIEGIRVTAGVGVVKDAVLEIGFWFFPNIMPITRIPTTKIITNIKTEVTTNHLGNLMLFDFCGTIG